jgi:hypothetical protein
MDTLGVMGKAVANIPSGFANGVSHLATGVVNLPTTVFDGYADLGNLILHPKSMTTADLSHTPKLNVANVPAVFTDSTSMAAYNTIDITTQLVGSLAIGKLPIGSAADALGGVAKPSTFVRTEALSGRASGRTVSEIADSMRTQGWQGPPIKTVQLDDSLYVVDGHHRLAAAQRVGLDVPYEVVDPATVIGPGSWSSVDDILRDAFSVGPDRIR